MHILITGGGGFVGMKLAKALIARGELCGKKITRINLCDLEAPVAPASEIDVITTACDISDAAAVDGLMAGGVDVIYHLAAVVSGAAEADFDLGMRVNLFGGLNVLESARKLGTTPIVVFASSCAVHGGEVPEVVLDGLELNPQTSYGAQKAITELLLNDMTRKGFIDGRGLRLPTVSIRPGVANAAASSFMSSIFREPLQGEAANCPVGRDFAVWHTAPRTIVENMIHAAEVDGALFGPNRNLNLPGRTDTIGEMIDAMTSTAGPEPEKLITWDTDPVIETIVMGWRNHFRPGKGLKLGFKADESFADSVRWFMEDDHRDLPT